MSETATQTKSPESQLKTRYDSEIRPALGKKFGCTNSMSQPRIDKVVLNVNMGRHLDGTKIPANIKHAIIDTLTTVSGQKPVVIKAKRSVSNFKVRKGYETAVRVTLRREKMWDFLDRLINLYTPRIKDFRGLKESSFDPQGNYSMGLNEQAVFPEVDMSRTNFIHGMNINVVFCNSNAEMSRFALAELGMPFRKPEEK